MNRLLSLKSAAEYFGVTPGMARKILHRAKFVEIARVDGSPLRLYSRESVVNCRPKKVVDARLRV